MKSYQNKIILIFTKTFVPAGALVLAVCLSLAPVSCRQTEDMIVVLDGDFTVPQIQSYSVLSENLLQVDFSKSVQAESATLSLKGGLLCSEVSFSSSGQSILFSFEKETVTGVDYVLDSVVRDANGNSLTLNILFTGFNSNPAGIVLSELRNAYGTASVTVGEEKYSVHKSEFVELYVQKSGSLSGFEIYSASDGDSKKFVLPPIEVNAGEYIVCHMRTVAAEGFDGQGMINELDDDFTLSTHIDSCNDARDLWSVNSKACFADSDVIVIRNTADGSILDALVFAKSGAGDFSSAFAEMFERVKKTGLWSAEPLCSDSITSSAVTRSMSRRVLECGSTDWIITADTGSGSKKIYGVTPGWENSSNEYKN